MARVAVRTVLAAVLAGRAVAHAAEMPGQLLRYPDVSATQIVFVYDNDVWLAPKTGGQAVPLSSPAGAERFPRFSPDGAKVAFSANYDGNEDVYELPVAGGIPRRLTVQPYGARTVDYSPDGRVVFATADVATGMETQLWYADPRGGLPERLPCVYGDMASFSADGTWMAFTPYRHVWQDGEWNRYQGGQAADVWTFDLATHASRQLTNYPGTDDVPMVCGQRVFFLSDAGPEHRRNLWMYDLTTGQRSQVTHFTEAETRWPACGPQDIVLQNGGTLWRLPLDTLQATAVEVQLPGDRRNARPRTVEAGGPPSSASVSPGAKRIAIEAHGDIWTIPAAQGYAQALEPTDRFAEREPAWSPDGASIAYISDRSGMYEIYLRPADGSGQSRQLTGGSSIRMGGLHWSPDSTRLAYSDRSGTIYVVAVAGGDPLQVASDPYGFQPAALSWSPDSRWLAYSLSDLKTTNSTIRVYDCTAQASHAVTAPAFDSFAPCFDLSGDFLYFASNQSLSPLYSDVDEYDTFLFVNSTQLAVLPLRKDVASPFLPCSDEEPAGTAAGQDQAETGGSAGSDPPEGGKAGAAKLKPVTIDFDGILGRALPLPLEPGSYSNLLAGDHKLFYLRHPRAGATGGSTELKLFDLAAAQAGMAAPSAAEAEESGEAAPDFGRSLREGVPGDSALLPEASGFQLTPDGAQLLVFVHGQMFVLPAMAGAPPPEQPVPLPALPKQVDPYQEWTQMIWEVWRSYKDEFYDPKLHGVDWDGARDRALALLPYVACTEDLGFLLSEMVAELNVGHSYVIPAASDDTAHMPLGLLACDFERATDAQGHSGIRISHVYRGADWELDASGPLSAPGVDIAPGSFLLAVDGVALDPARSPYTALLGRAGMTVQLTVGASAARDATTRDVLVTALSSDAELRHRAWVEANRRYVAEHSGGRVGYIHVRDTADGGIIDLQRQFLGQHNLDALVIDERYNGGGFIAHRFIEMLDRPTLMYDSMRFGQPLRFPRRSAPGAKVMLVNQYAGSGGDGFPWLFRHSGLGPIVGVRTWGGWVGTAPNLLLDGTVFFIPMVHDFETDGTWMLEGYGVDPDIVQVNDPQSLAAGRDLQLDKSIEVALAEAKAHPWIDPPRPAGADRSGVGTLPADR